MNAAVVDIPLPAGTETSGTAAANDALSDSIIARALAEAASSGGSAREILSRESGLSGTAYASALARAFDYRLLSEGELANMEADFGLLPPA